MLYTKIMRQKGFSVILILVGIVILAGILISGRYYLELLKNSPQDKKLNNIANKPSITNTKQTSGWKTFISADNQFSITYPTNWIVQNYEGYPSLLFPPKNQNITIEENYQNAEFIFEYPELIDGYISTEFPGNNSNGSWENITESEFYDPNSKFRHLGDFGGGESRFYKIPTKLTMENIVFMKQIDIPNRSVSTQEPGVIGYNYTTLTNNQVFSIRFRMNYQNPNKAIMEKTLDEIVSTVKFLK